VHEGHGGGVAIAEVTGEEEHQDGRHAVIGVSLKEGVDEQESDGRWVGKQEAQPCCLLGPRWRCVTLARS
jgi:hypothetical protein